MGKNSEEDMQVDAARMVREQLAAHIRDERVLNAMRRVPRHRFVNPADRDRAYDDRPLPTAHGQTISQPLIVALMTEMLDVHPNMRVLEIGTGSGYQTAILAELGATVVSIDRVSSLTATAEAVLRELGYHDRITLLTGDGTLGAPQHAPFDRILVTAGAPHIPQAYREQLRDGGKIVIPVGTREQQTLTVATLSGNEWLEQKSIGCRFVPLVGEQGWR